MFKGFYFIFLIEAELIYRVVGFCCTAKWFSYAYVYILSYILFHYSSAQDVEYRSL